ncbi:MAG: thiol-disulfide oxidoreductase DCC family protein [Terriglobales bacterium]
MNWNPRSLVGAGYFTYGGCGFCFRWVHFWEKVFAGRGFALKDLQSAYSDGSLQISQENLLDDIQVLTRAGKLESGANAYLYVTRLIWWAWPFYGIFSLPGFNRILWQGYRWFNRNRYRISRHCSLPEHPDKKGTQWLTKSRDFTH